MKLKTKIELAILNNLVWVLLVLFFVFNALSTPSFFSSRNMVNILYQSSTLALMVLGQGIVMMVGELDLSMEATLAFAPGVTILLANQLGIHPVICILMTLLFGTVIGWFNGFCVTKLRTNSFLLTMSTQIIMRGLVLFLVPFSIPKLADIYTFLGRGKIGSVQAAIIAAAVIYLVFELIFRKNAFGRRFLITGGNRRAAFISGINTERVVVYAFMLAGLLSAVAGLVTAGRQNAVSNSMGEGMVMMAFAGAILGGCSFNGGQGAPIGMLGGTLLLGMIDNALNLRGVDINLVSATKGALIFAAILLDRLRFSLTAHIMHRENLRKLQQADQIKTAEGREIPAQTETENSEKQEEQP